MKKKYYRFFYYLNTLSKALNNKQNFLTPEIKDLIDSEKFLDLDILIQKLILEFRKKFLNINFIEFSDKYKSPEINTEIFSYERAFDKTDFFLEELNKLPKNFFCFRNLTNSGMSAISLILLLLKKILNHNMRLGYYSDYFETENIIHVLEKNPIKIRVIEDFEKNNINVLFLEYPTYFKKFDFDLIDLIINKINNTDKTFFIIIDTSLESLNILKFYTILNNKNIILIEVKSGLKMYQLGLELFNLGIYSIIGKNSNIIKKLYELSLTLKGILGYNVPVFNYLILKKYNIFENKVFKKRYVKQILYNNYLFFSKISINKFEKVFFYSEYKKPFVFFKFKNKNDFNKFKNFIFNQKKEYFIINGMSFGFLTTRYEFIDKLLLFKVSVGFFYNYSTKKLLETILKYFKEENN